jgi:hypothetical protein
MDIAQGEHMTKIMANWYREQGIPRETTLKLLRDAIQKGIESGDATPFNMDDKLKKAHRRFKEPKNGI